MRVLALSALALAALLLASPLPAQVTADSPACTAVKKQIAYLKQELAKIEKQQKFDAKAKIKNEVRKQQLETRKQRLEADLKKAEAKKAEACGDVSVYDGMWQAKFQGTTTANIQFTVKSGKITGGMRGTIDPKTGNADVTSDFDIGADCTGKVHFNKNGTGSTIGQITCKLFGQTSTGTLVDIRRK